MKPIRILVLVLLSVLAAPLAALGAPAASTAMSADQASILESLRIQALEYTKKLPNFICTQVTLRETSDLDAFGNFNSGVPDRVLSFDRIEEKLTYFDQKERYQVIAINSRKVAGVEHTRVAGAISSGEFGSLMHDIFAPATHTAFSWNRMDKLHGRKAYVFAFQVPREAGIHVSHKQPDQDIVASYGGLIFVDADTKRLMRITTHIDLPAWFAIRGAERLVDYKPATIAGKSYNLPFNSRILMKDSEKEYVNKISYENYQKFTVNSTIKYGNEPLGPTPQPDSAALAAPAEQPAPPSDDAALIEPTTEQQATQGPASNRNPNAGSPSERQPPQTAKADTPQIAPQSASQTTAQTATQTPSQTATLATAQSATVRAAPATTFPAQPSPPNAPTPDFHLRVGVNLVMVPVVVRDAQGQPVGNLTEGDFQLFDKGKRQQITSFTMKTQTRQSAAADGLSQPSGGGTDSAAFIVYLFDDVHLKFADLGKVRDAAGRSFDALQPTDWAAIFTTSGRDVLNFTRDRAKLHDALLKLAPHPLDGAHQQECPDVSPYMADLILNVNNPYDLSSNPPLQAAVAETAGCLALSPNMPGAAEAAVSQAMAAARRAEALGEPETRGTLLAIKQAIQMASQAPGNKNIILASPGFFVTTSLQPDALDVVERAIAAGVTISALDARGLYTLDAAGSIEHLSANATTSRLRSGYDRDEAKLSSDVLEQMAEGTGGAFVHNTNDLDAGLKRLAAAPEYIYLLGFAPQKLKADGSFHPLKVKLTRDNNLSLQSRRGYYAVKH